MIQKQDLNKILLQSIKETMMNSKIDKYECEFLGDGLRYEFTEFERRVSSGDVAASQRDEAVTRARVFEKFLSGREH